jgi:hypothetical protein
MPGLRAEFGETMQLGALSRGRVVYLETFGSERVLQTTVPAGLPVSRVDGELVPQAAATLTEAPRHLERMISVRGA